MLHYFIWMLDLFYNAGLNTEFDYNVIPILTCWGTWGNTNLVWFTHNVKPLVVKKCHCQNKY
jgi:hypothetical protein